MGEFWGDVKKAVGTWRVVPALPLITVLVQLPSALQKLHPLWGLAIFPLGIFYVGFVGTERLWYLRVWAGETLTPREIWRVTWGYVGRYFALALLVAVPGIVGYLVLGFLLGLLDFDPTLGRTITMIIVGIATDVALTFVTPALAFSTNHASEAIGDGLKFLKAQGRRALAYALVPPLLALALLQRTPDSALSGLPRVTLAIVGTLVYLACKGATAAKYLRHHEVNKDALPLTDPVRRGEAPLRSAPGAGRTDEE